jgi:hypothetical protein
MSWALEANAKENLSHGEALGVTDKVVCCRTGIPIAQLSESLLAKCGSVYQLYGSGHRVDSARPGGAPSGALDFWSRLDPPHTPEGTSGGGLLTNKRHCAIAAGTMSEGKGAVTSETKKKLKG